jgi:6,7-dimethyl-8-ribityllumazine synthase
MHVDEITGSPARGRNIGVVVSDFNRTITDALLKGAMEALATADTAQVTVLRVPGALELPVAARRLIEAGCDGVVAIGAVIKGETDHYEHVATQTVGGLSHLALVTGVPIANSVLTVQELEHAMDRSQPGRGNKGYEAAEAVLVTVNALGQVSEED